MKRNITRSFAMIVACLFLAQAITTRGQQMADPDFDTKVARPAYTKKHPKVLFDEAHRNFHTTDGRYKPFATLISNDGYQVTPNKEKFQKSTLKGYDILVIANASGLTPISEPPRKNLLSRMKNATLCAIGCAQADRCC